MTTSADLGILYIAGQQAQPEITHNTALNQLQMLLTGAISAGLNTPPGSPAQGDTYILGASPTGAWAGRANCFAGYFGTAWVFVPGNNSSGTPITMGVRHEGLRVWNKATDSVYTWSGSAWVAGAVASITKHMSQVSMDPTVASAFGFGFFGGRAFIVPEDCTLTHMGFVAASASATSVVYPAVYAKHAASNSLGARLGTGSAVTGVTAGVNTIPFTSGVVLTKGTLVWVGIVAQTANVPIATAIAGSPTAYFATAGAPPDPAPATTHNTTQTWGSMWPIATVP